jgi:hypothetical protein
LVLAFELELLRGERATATARRRVVQSTCDRAKGHRQNVHALSHRLHPARLQMLRRVASALAQELSTPDLPIGFSRQRAGRRP